MPQHFDLIVIGTGAAAGAIAHPCRSAGWSVAVVDSRPYGGTCANRGCDPKKVLVGGAQLVDWARRMRGRGVAGELRIDWADLMRFKHTFTDPVPQSSERGFEQQGIASLDGPARFTAPDAIEIDGKPFTAAHFAIAAGAAPAPLGIPAKVSSSTATSSSISNVCREASSSPAAATSHSSSPISPAAPEPSSRSSTRAPARSNTSKRASWTAWWPTLARSESPSN